MDKFSFPVPVVRLIIRDEEDRVLLLRRENASYAAGDWCLPGGKVDYGEKVEGAAAKELREETSLELASARFLFYQDVLPLEKGKMHGINFYFECTVTGSIKLNEESSEVAWVGADELSGYRIAFRNDEGLARYWRERWASSG